MWRYNYLLKNYPHLFDYLPALQVHPHDRFVDRFFLRFLPDNVTPNRLTVLRIILTPIVFLFVLFGFYRLGAIFFLIAALTDVLDGSLARTRNQITSFGILFDPLADKFLIGSMVLLLVFRYFNFWLGVALLGIEIIFITSALVYRKKFETPRMANLWGKIKMFLQVVATFLVLLALVFEVPYFFTAAFWLFGLAVGFAIVSLFTHGI